MKKWMKKSVSALSVMAMLVSASPAFAISSSVNPASVIVTNNFSGASSNYEDTVKITGLTGTNTIRVYDYSGTRNLLGLEGNMNSSSSVAGWTGTSLTFSQNSSNSSSSPNSLLATGTLSASTAYTINKTFNGLSLSQGSYYVAVAKLKSSSTSNLSVKLSANTSGEINLANTIANGGAFTPVAVKFTPASNSTTLALSFQFTPTVTGGYNLYIDDIAVYQVDLNTYNRILTSTTGYTTNADIDAKFPYEDNGFLMSKVSSTNATETLTIPQLGTTSGFIGVTVDNNSNGESDPTIVAYDAEPITNAVDPASITVTNNPSGTNDVVEVTGLNSTDVMKVYYLDANNKYQSITFSSPAIVNGKWTGTTSTDLNTYKNVHITRQEVSKWESNKTSKAVPAIPVAPMVNASQVNIKNDSGTNTDTVSILQNTTLLTTDTVSIYTKIVNGKPDATSKVSATATIGSDGTAKFNLPANTLVKSGGSLYLTNSRTGFSESAVLIKTYNGEAKSVPVLGADVDVTNGIGGTDYVTVKNLTTRFAKVNGEDVFACKTGCTVTVYYKDRSGTDQTTSGTVTAGTMTTKLGPINLSETQKYFEVTITSSSPSRDESLRTKIYYKDERNVTTLSPKNISITNAVGVSDTVTVSNINAGDTVRVFNRNSTQIGSGTVATNANSVSITVDLGTKNGSGVYVQWQPANGGSSKRVYKTFVAESKTTALASNQITITNRKNDNDLVNVTFSGTAPTYRIYLSKYDTTPISVVSTVTTSSPAVITIASGTLSPNGGTLYITATSASGNESVRVAKTYGKE